MFSSITVIGTNSAIILPEFDKFAVQFGAFGIRWYALAYLVGLLGGWLLLRREAKDPRSPLTIETVDALLNYVLFGIIIGGRLGYVIFYNSAYYLAHPSAILRIWEGGMAFHGALLGIAIAVLIMARRHQITFFSLTDRICIVAPIGLFFGRLSNFINGELYGRVTTAPWAMIFPNSDGQPRHPSQLYEACLEGLLLGIIMLILWRRGWLLQDGRITGVLLAGYGLARSLIEFVREPDAQLGFIVGNFSMGQILSVPMIIFGLYLIMRKPATSQPLDTSR
jgi:phosphatidylglycerol:prolipoprotein diacylglycerol transferase